MIVSEKIAEKLGYKDIFIAGKEVISVWEKDKMIWENNMLPVGYTECDYLYNAGATYIDTEIATDDTVGIAMSFTIPSSDQVAMGSRDLTSTNSRLTINPNNSAVNLGWNWYSTIALRKAETWHYVENNLYNSRTRSLYYDGEVTNSIKITETLLCPNKRNIYIFAGNWGGSPGVHYYGKVKDIKITRGSHLVRDFVPCLNKYNTPGLFDKISRKFFVPSSGTVYAGFENSSTTADMLAASAVAVTGTNTMSLSGDIFDSLSDDNITELNNKGYTITSV